MPTPLADPTPLVREEQLLDVFVQSEKTGQWLGLEMEKFGVLEGGVPIDYDGPRGVLAFFEALRAGGSWQPDSEYPGGPVLALLRADGASITLEPGSQLELSGAQQPDVHAVAAEVHEHFAELAPISRQLGVRWLGLGFHPFAARDAYRFVPKQRYAIMREYLPTRGPLALDMMLRTSTVQVNFDYASEADAMKKLRVGQALAPLTTALFANSPFYEGAPFGGKSYRGRVWLGMDPDRSGLVQGLFSEHAGYRDYIEWAHDCPMFLVKRGERVLVNAGQRFRDYWRDGFEGERASVGDWQMHLNTLFPDVRLKKTIEVRGADSQSAEHAPELAALYTGLFYDHRALDLALELVADVTFDEVLAARARVPELALATPWRGSTLVALAEKVIDIAEAGLERRSFRDGRGADERVHLATLKARVARGECPADEVLRRAGAEGFSRAAILAASEIPLPD